LWVVYIGHYNIIKTGPRDFSSVEEMNKSIVETLKGTTKDNIIFELGDLFWNIRPEYSKKILESIPAKIYKVLGNHDKYKMYLENDNGFLRKYFETVSDTLEIKVEYQDEITRCFLSHYPLLSWNHKSRGSFMIHGHCHGNIDRINSSSTDLRVDVGYDGELAKSCNNFLIEFKDIYTWFFKKTGGMNFTDWVSKRGIAI
jgi:calcineurin-like phosphoesterase family protein